MARNEGLIQQIFARESAKAILKLQVADDGVVDRWFWPLESSGDFTVKSVHKALVSHRINNVAPFRPDM